jgi:hypothetical protein
MQSTSIATFRWLAGMVFMAILAPLGAAQETELKDETGKTILKYVIEVPPGIAAAGTVDPAKQAGLILCSQEHDTPTGNDLFPVRQSLVRQGLLDQYVLAPAPQGRKFGPDDHQPIEKLIAWAKKTYPINEQFRLFRRRREGGDLAAARHAWNLYRNGEGVERNAAIANQWAKVIGEPVQASRTTPPATATPPKR